MNEQTQGNNPDVSSIIPVKRKRGRPRKYPRPDLGHGGNPNFSWDQNLGHGGNPRPSPALGGVNRNQPCQAELVNDEMVGQLVHGVIDAAFDAGYLLTVRVGTSDTTLRGVVFKPGRYVPVSAENDVAPGVQMIRRNEIPVPKENYTYCHSHNHQSRDKNGTAHGTQSNPVVSKGKQAPLMMTQTSLRISRAKMGPVVLQPVNVNVTNGVSTAGHSGTGHADRPGSSKGKQVQNPVHPSNGSAPTNQVLHVQSQNDHQPSVMPSASGPCNQNPAEAQLQAEAKSMQLPENDVSDTDQPLSVEPLQSIQPAPHIHPAVATRTLENYRTRKMTELLQILQENMTENQATQAKELAEDTRPKLDELNWPERELGNESDRSKKQSRGSSV